MLVVRQWVWKGMGFCVEGKGGSRVSTFQHHVKRGLRPMEGLERLLHVVGSSGHGNGSPGSIPGGRSPCLYAHVAAVARRFLWRALAGMVVPLTLPSPPLSLQGKPPPPREDRSVATSGFAKRRVSSKGALGPDTAHSSGMPRASTLRPRAISRYRAWSAARQLGPSYAPPCCHAPCS